MTNPKIPTKYRACTFEHKGKLLAELTDSDTGVPNYIDVSGCGLEPDKRYKVAYLFEEIQAKPISKELMDRIIKEFDRISDGQHF